jgi:hypothetical protein
MNCAEWEVTDREAGFGSEYVTEINDIQVFWNGKYDFEFYVNGITEAELMEHCGIKSPNHALSEAKMFIEEFGLVAAWEDQDD